MNTNELWTAPIVKGSGAKDKKNCSVELLGKIIYGDMRHGYHLPCIDAGAQAATVAVSDMLSDKARQSRRWRLLIARLGTCHNTHSTRLGQRMALWSARSVERHSDDPCVKACNDTVERWLAGEATLEEVAGAAAAGAGAAGADDVALMEWLDAYLTAWHKAAANEGLLAGEIEDELVRFVESLDWEAGGEA